MRLVPQALRRRQVRLVRRTRRTQHRMHLVLKAHQRTLLIRRLRLAQRRLRVRRTRRIQKQRPDPRLSPTLKANLIQRLLPELKPIQRVRLNQRKRPLRKNGGRSNRTGGFHETARSTGYGPLVCGLARCSRHAVTTFAGQLFTNAPKRSSALAKLSPVAAKPRRKCEGASKQSPGASKIPRSVAA